MERDPQHKMYTNNTHSYIENRAGMYSLGMLMKMFQGQNGFNFQPKQKMIEVKPFSLWRRPRCGQQLSMCIPLLVNILSIKC